MPAGRDLALAVKGRSLARGVWKELKAFSAADGGATFLWPRWIVLRAIGLVYVIIFAGILVEARALVAPQGIAPIAGYLSRLAGAEASPLDAFCRAPSLFWFGASAGAIAALAWAGLAAAMALALNVWPRLSLFACWIIFLSFVSTWSIFSGAQLDPLMLEAALLAIPFAPAGLRPGLGEDSPPLPIAVFTMRWLLFRVMFESGIFKIASGDPYWRHLTAMKIMYETTPFPTILGYFDHHLPFAYHVFEIGLTFAAELAAPVLAVFGGRRGRWTAFALWTVFQAGIQLTNNFGWLNVAAIGLGFLLLDDQMLAGLGRRLGLRPPASKPRPAAASPLVWVLRGALACHFCLTLYFFRAAWEDAVSDVRFAITSPLDLTWFLQSANAYHLYARMSPERYAVEFEGSNDGGATWRTYPFRYQPQRADHVSPFIAPWYPRFEASLQIAVSSVPKSPLFTAVAAELLSRNPHVMGLFGNDPFPDRPPTMVRMPVYRMSFTDWATRERTGCYWNKTYVGDYAPMVYRDDQGNLQGG